MSASEKKKLRKEQNAAAMTEKQKAEQKKQSTTKAYTLTFAVAMVLVVVLVLCAVLQTPVTGLIWNNTAAATVNGATISASELNYFYYDAINEFYSQFSSYGNYQDFYVMWQTGLYPSKSLDSQVYDEESGDTWADYFIDQAVEQAKWTHTMYNAAMADKDFEISESVQSSLDSLETYYDLYASFSGYSTRDAYVRAMYGDGASFKSFSEYYEMVTIASAYASEYYSGLEFDNDAIRGHEKDKMQEYNSFSYAYYYLDADKYLTGGKEVEGEDGKTTIEYSDEEIAAALEAALADAKMLVGSGVQSFEELDKLIASLSINVKEEESEDKEDKTEAQTEGETTEGETTEGETTEGETTEGETTEDKTTDEEYEIQYITSNKNQVYSLLKSYCEYYELSEDMVKWISDAARAPHNMTYLPKTTTDDDGKETTEGYFVVYFSESFDNTTYHVGNVRHIVIEFEKDKDGNLVKDAVANAWAKAEEVLTEYEDGEMTVAEFTALAKKYSADKDSSGNLNSNGSTSGLYENVTPDSGYVSAFWQWACGEHEEGDVEIIETELGCHIMYYVSGSELNYRDYLIHQDLVDDAYTTWEEGLLKDISAELVNDKYVDRDLVISG